MYQLFFYLHGWSVMIFIPDKS